MFYSVYYIYSNYIMYTYIYTHNIVCIYLYIHTHIYIYICIYISTKKGGMGMAGTEDLAAERRAGGSAGGT